MNFFDYFEGYDHEKILKAVGKLRDSDKRILYHQFGSDFSYENNTTGYSYSKLKPIFNKINKLLTNPNYIPREFKNRSSKNYGKIVVYYEDATSNSEKIGNGKKKKLQAQLRLDDEEFAQIMPFLRKNGFYDYFLKLTDGNLNNFMNLRSLSAEEKHKVYNLIGSLRKNIHILLGYQNKTLKDIIGSDDYSFLLLKMSMTGKSKMKFKLFGDNLDLPLPYNYFQDINWEEFFKSIGVLKTKFTKLKKGENSWDNQNLEDIIGVSKENIITFIKSLNVGDLMVVSLKLMFGDNLEKPYSFVNTMDDNQLDRVNISINYLKEMVPRDLKKYKKRKNGLNNKYLWEVLNCSEKEAIFIVNTLKDDSLALKYIKKMFGNDLDEFYDLAKFNNNLEGMHHVRQAIDLLRNKIRVNKENNDNLLTCKFKKVFLTRGKYLWEALGMSKEETLELVNLIDGNTEAYYYLKLMFGEDFEERYDQNKVSDKANLEKVKQSVYYLKQKRNRIKKAKLEDKDVVLYKDKYLWEILSCTKEEMFRLLQLFDQNSKVIFYTKMMFGNDYNLKYDSKRFNDNPYNREKIKQKVHYLKEKLEKYQKDGKLEIPTSHYYWDNKYLWEILECQKEVGLKLAFSLKKDSTTYKSLRLIFAEDFLNKCNWTLFNNDTEKIDAFRGGIGYLRKKLRQANIENVGNWGKKKSLWNDLHLWEILGCSYEEVVDIVKNLRKNTMVYACILNVFGKDLTNIYDRNKIEDNYVQTISVAIDYLRNRLKLRKHQSISPKEPSIKEIVPREETHVEELIMDSVAVNTSEEAKYNVHPFVVEFINTLPLDIGIPLKLYLIDRITIKEIAEVFNTDELDITTRLKKGKLLLEEIGKLYKKNFALDFISNNGLTLSLNNFK